VITFIFAKILSFGILAIAAFIAAQTLTGIEVENFSAGLGGAFVYTIFQFSVGWALWIFLMPMALFTLGFVVNALLHYVTSYFVDGYKVRMSAAFKGAVMLSAVDWGLNGICFQLA
jgi:uncharacterized membrane protein YvlD (DUF360 family)